MDRSECEAAEPYRSRGCALKGRRNETTGWFNAALACQLGHLWLQRMGLLEVRAARILKPHCSKPMNAPSDEESLMTCSVTIRQREKDYGEWSSIEEYCIIGSTWVWNEHAFIVRR